MFLLSLDEVVRYFGDSGQLGGSQNGRVGFRDRFNDERTAHKLNGLAWLWWLRSPGIFRDYVAVVHYDGTILVGGSRAGSRAVYYVIGVRPAMWLRP